jgi:NifU-like protein
MWEYTGKVREHYLNPQNIGEIESPDGYGEIGNIKCGDALRLTFNLDDDKKINEIKFKTFGCGSAIASSSMLTLLCEGKSLEEAEKITNDDIAEALGGLPDAKMHCSVMGQEALEAAIDYYRKGGKTVKKEVTSRLVCSCFNVTEDDIVSVIKQNGLVSVEQITNYTKAGGGCGACLSDIGEILEKTNREIDEEHAHDHGSVASCVAPQKNPMQKKLTTIEKIDLIRKVLNENIRPALQRDGGDCELIDVDGDIVQIKFIGACSSCSFSGSTQNDFIEKTLKEKVVPSIKVALVK